MPTASERIRAAREEQAQTSMKEAEVTDYHVESRKSNVDYKLERALKEWIEVHSEYDGWIAADPAAHLQAKLLEVLEEVATQTD